MMKQARMFDMVEAQRKRTIRVVTSVVWNAVFWIESCGIMTAKSTKGVKGFFRGVPV